MKFFLKLLLMVGLINPGLSLAKSKNTNPNKNEVSVELSQTDELPETTSKNHKFKKTLIAVGIFTATVIAGVYYSQQPPKDGGSPDGTTLLKDILANTI